MSFSRMHYDLLLVQMVRNPGIMQLATRSLEPSFFSNEKVGGTAAHVVLFDIFKSFYEKFRTAPDQATVMVEAQTLINRYFKDPKDPMVDEIWRGISIFYHTLRLADDKSIKLAQEMIAHISRICVFDTKARAAIEGALSSNQMVGLADVISGYEKDLRGLAGGSSVTGDALDTAPEEFKERIQTGVPWLDARLGDGKGPVRGCGMAVIAKQGHGKSTLGYQILSAQVLAGRHALLAIAEEGLSVDVKRCLRAAVTGVSVTSLAKFRDDYVKAAEHDGLDVVLVQKKVDLQKKYLHVLDLVENPGDMGTISVEVERLKLIGEGPEVIYIDWAGPIANHMMDAAGRTGESREPFVREVGTLTNRLGETGNCLAICAHQMGTEAQKRGPMADNDMTCAMDSKMFTQSMKYCVVINPRDERTGICKFRIPKARNDKPDQWGLIKLDGPHVRFEELVGWVQQGKHFANPSSSRAKLPQEQSKRNNQQTE